MKLSSQAFLISLKPLILAGAFGFTLALASAAEDFTITLRNRVKPQAEPFALSEVRLLDGPFKHAQAMDQFYLLSLDVDQLLHTFRINAGLPSYAQPLGGWEEPKCEVRGHFVGHYLSACALMYASTGDARLKAKGDALVAGLAACQARFPSGYLSAYPEEFIDRVEKQQQVWAPYYTLHKLFAGLLDMSALAGNRQALEVARRYGDWVIARNDRLTDPQMQAMLGNEHGGMNECLANLYALTGEDKYLKIAFRFNHQALIAPFSHHEDNLTGKHANTQFPKFIGAAREYELTGDESLRSAAAFFWGTVVKERSYVIGGNSDGEMFTPKEKLSTALGPNTTETCNTYNMLKLTRHLFSWNPQSSCMDFYERGLYNHILASQNPETGGMCYYVPLKSGSLKKYGGPLDAFWCCTGTGVENHAKYGDSIYFHTGDHTLFVNLFIASELDWQTRGLKVRQETKFPEQGSTRLSFSCAQPVELKVKIRVPSWAHQGIKIAVNGKTWPASPQPDGYALVSRVWKTGDQIRVTMPLRLHTEAFADNPNRLAFLNGPIVLCTEVNPGKQFPAVVAEPAEAIEALTPTRAPNAFAASRSVFRTADNLAAIKLEPFYAMHGNRQYQVYFDRFTPDQWQKKQADYAAELARQRELTARTVDFVVPDREQSERDHNMQGEQSSAGDFGEHKWRHATDGGWFSWQLKVVPNQAQNLCVTYWGSDGGNRIFDLLVDGKKLATQRLENNRPEQFFDETYRLSEGLVNGRQSITLRFQAHPGAWAGGVFGVRVMKLAAPDGSP
jgi:uncharacterized protein